MSEKIIIETTRWHTEAEAKAYQSGVDALSDMVLDYADRSIQTRQRIETVEDGEVFIVEVFEELDEKNWMRLTMTVNYEILLNESKDESGRHIAMWDGYTVGDELKSVYTGTIEASEPVEHFAVCEQLFYKFNMNHPPDYHNRSLSVGDVIILEWNGQKKRFSVERFGFKEI